MYHTICTSCTAFILVSYPLRIAMDHVEKGREEPPEPAPVEDTDPEQDQGKPRCILSHPLSFIYLFLLLYDA
jgi:hypothetical protein